MYTYINCLDVLRVDVAPAINVASDQVMRVQERESSLLTTYWSESTQ